VDIFEPFVVNRSLKSKLPESKFLVPSSMKEKIHLLICIVFCLIARPMWAQPSLPSGSLATAGTTLYYDLDTVKRPFSLAVTGAGQTFTLPNALSTRTIGIQFLNPSNTQYGSKFSNATVAVQFDKDLTYYEDNGSYFAELGYVRRPNSRFVKDTTFVLTSPVDLVRYPSTLGTSFADTAKFFFQGPASLLGFSTTIIFSKFLTNRYLERTSECPATGSLTVDGQTFNNVILEKFIDKTVDTIRIYNLTCACWIGGIPVGGIPEISRDTITTYNFWEPSQPYFLAQIQVRKDSIFRIATRNFTATAVENTSPLLVSRMYPVPAAHELKIDFGSKLPVGRQVQIYNTLGQPVGITTTAQSEQSITLDVHGLANGIYLAKVFDANGEQLNVSTFLVSH
jgi:hypothetical protein